MINNLQTLRGICALLAFTLHFGFNNLMIENTGDFLVTTFMMISGFVLTLSSLKKPSKRSIGSIAQFMTGRLIHIYPLYLLALLITLPLRNFDMSAGPVIANLLMIQSWFPNIDYFFSGNSPSWFISSIMFCYLIFLPVFWLATTRKKLALNLLALFLISYFAIVINIPNSLVKFTVYIFPPMQFASFLLGMILALMHHKKKWAIDSAPAANVLIIGAFALNFVVLYFQPQFSPRFTLSSYWWISAGVLMAVCVATDKTESTATSILHLKPFVNFGNISFSFYIIHYPWILGTRFIIRQFGLSIPFMIEYIISFIVLAILSYYLYRYFEIPVTKKLKSLSVSGKNS